MKITTWNIERPLKASPKNAEVISLLRSMEADIYILTETHEVIQPFDDYHCFSTTELDGPFYKEGERRTMIWSRYPAIKTFPTYDDKTAICVQLDTPLGKLIVYGTVMGVFGNRKPDYLDEVSKQIADIRQLAAQGPVCLAGDLNMTFRDNYYHTEAGRKLLNNAFAELNLKILTYDVAKNIDHVVVSQEFINGRKCWTEPPVNTDYKLSDHIGVVVNIAED